jgi:hypothetical protein
MGPRFEYVRAYLYRVALVVQPTLGALGIAKESKAFGIAALIIAVLSVGMAATNTSTER